MIFDYTPKGVCSKKMRVTLDDKNVIEKVEVLGGCSGNLQGISSLVVGMSAEEAIRRMRGIRWFSFPLWRPKWPLSTVRA